MPGWNNPLPIGQSARSIARGWWKKSFSRSLPCPEAIARYPWARERSAHIGPSNSRELETSKLATTRVLISKLATARVLCVPTYHPNADSAPLLSSRNISVATISLASDKGRDIPPMPPTVDLRKKCVAKEGIARMVFGFLTSLYFLVFHSLSY